MWKTVAKWTLLVLLLVYVGVMFVWSRAEAARHRCHGIEVNIEGRGTVASISEKSVLEVLEGYPKPIVGQPIHSINTLEIAEYLRKFNNFESIDCLITTQGTLKVSVVPMIPEIRVFDGDKSYYVNKDGKTMTAIPGFFVDVPVVSGSFNKDFHPRTLLPVVRFIQQDSLLRSLTGMVVARDKNNILIVPRMKGHVINLGDTTRLQEKRNAILTAYRSVLPYRGWEMYDTISVKFKGQIVATRRDKTPLHPLPEIAEEEDYEESALASHAAGEERSEPKPQSNEE